MKINQNRPDTQKVPVSVINTMLEQISDLQEDTAELDARIDQLGTNVDTVSVSADSVGTNTLTVRNEASIDDLTVQDVTAQNINASGISASDGNITNIVANTVTSASETVESLTAANAGIQQLEAVNGQIVNLESTDIETNQLDANTIHTNGINNSGNYTGKDLTVENVTASGTFSANNIAATSANITGNLGVNGNATIRGTTSLGRVIADTIDANNKLYTPNIETQGISISTRRSLRPSPALDNNDFYTVELPQFTGVYIIRWYYDNAERWSATVVGDGTDYSITFASHFEDEGYVQKLFQWNNKLYIRHNANGVMYYSYDADKPLPEPTIYYNMVGWTEPESLEELCDEKYQYDVVRPSGTVMFGVVRIMKQENGGDGELSLTFKGSCTIAELPPFEEVLAGDIWNITDDGFTNDSFVEGPGKPINAGDDVIAVEVKINDDKVLRWGKFAAGVNYDNFQAYDITATHALKSEGTLEVDGNTVLHNTTVTGNLDVTGTVKTDTIQSNTAAVPVTINDNLSVTGSTTVTTAITSNGTLTVAGVSTLHNTNITGNITQTGNQNVTGNETIIGKVTIGDLD